MGKDLQQNNLQNQFQDGNNNENNNNNRANGSSFTSTSSSSNLFFCERCGITPFCNFLVNEFNFKCFFVFILTLCLLVSVIFWILPFHHSSVAKSIGFDATLSTKLSATVQGYFRLPKPVSELIPHIERLEYDIHEEIGVLNAKVAILSMHPSKPDPSNCTDVVFGFVPDQSDVPIPEVSLSLLRSSLIELLLKESNLTLTSAIFGQPSVFEILKFPGGITVIPVPYAPIFKMAQIFFNFTLNNSIADILENLDDLRDQLTYGLHLRAYENIVVQITNSNGSSVDPPVTVEATVVSDLGSLLPQRLKQLVQSITDSNSKNLGLDNSVFGKVKSVVLSSYLKGRIHANPPSPSPVPSPGHNDYAEPPNPRCDPSLTPKPSPSARPKCGRRHVSHPVNPPAPSVVPADPPHPCRHRNFPVSRNRSPSKRSPYVGSLGPPSTLPPDLAPLPQVSIGSGPRKGSGSQSHAPSPLGLSLSSPVKAYFRLQKPVLHLLPHIRKLEYDLKQEIGIPTTKVAVLSLHPSIASNWTGVLFGFLPEHTNIPINQMYLRILREALVDIFLQESELALTDSIFGQPSAFEILKFPGGITVNPVQDTSICEMPEILFNFILNHSVADTLDNINELRDQLKFGLHLRPHESVIVQLTNTNGSTIYPPVTVQVSVVSHLGSLLPLRLKQLAHKITNSHAKNFGLDYWAFGKVKSVILSSYLKGILHPHAPTSPPAPSPELGDHADPPISTNPTCTPAPPDGSHLHATNPKCGPHHSVPHVNSAAPSISPPHPSGHQNSPQYRSPYFRPLGPTSQIPSDLTPLPQVSYGSTPSSGSDTVPLAPPLSAPSPSSAGRFCREIWWLGLSGLLVFHLLCCPQ